MALAKRSGVELARQIVEAQEMFESSRYAEARDLLNDFLKEHPGNAAVLRALGLVSTRLGQPAQALRFCLMAVQSNPQDVEAHFSLALLYLMHGRFEPGFVEYEWRLLRSNCIVPRYAEGATLWDGRPLQDEALMLHCEQGFGDNLQFIRFLPQLRARVKTIYLACHPELVRLFSGLEGLAGIVTDKQALPKCAYHVPLLSLPRLFKVTLATLPREVPYLPVSRAPKPRSDRPRVGLVWRANRSSPNGGYRSVPLELLRPLADLPVDWVSLQRDPDDAERAILRGDFRAEDLGATFLDFKDTAECLDGLDLLLTVDTSVTHVAGALGRPVWMLLPRWADWRWMQDRADSPWYPTLRLFRQVVDQEWAEPVRTLREELMQWIER